MYTAIVSKTEVVILAAGKGSRLGLDLPKALVEITPGHKLLNYQLDQLTLAFGASARISLVVGYKKELFLAYTERVDLLHNSLFETTNTAKSLAMALESIDENNSVLWINGDVYFDEQVLTLVARRILNARSFIGVQFGSVDDEAMKFGLDKKGNISSISKSITYGEGEAIGINFVSPQDRRMLLDALKLVESQDYFEKALDNLANSGGVTFEILDLTKQFVREIDFLTDLEVVKEQVKKS